MQITRRVSCSRSIHRSFAPTRYYDAVPLVDDQETIVEEIRMEVIGSERW